LLQLVDDNAHEKGEIGDSPAADTYCNAHTLLESSGDGGLEELRPQSPRDV
jgi:hypothetical protein